MDKLLIIMFLLWTHMVLCGSTRYNEGAYFMTRNYSFWMSAFLGPNSVQSIPTHVDLAIKSIGKLKMNNRKLWHPLILRNLVNKIMVIHRRTIQNKLHPSISSNMVKQALLLSHDLHLG